MNKPANKLTAVEAAALIRDGSLDATTLVEACLSRIAEREPAIKAWAHIDPVLARKQAAACDAGPARGPLHGIPIAIKDVIDTADQPTQMGSPIYAGHQPPADAAIVSLLRSAGAIILGKTVTAEFAGMAPAVTANPHNQGHTPGGSSSGSAAAVADMMVPIAFGTQTGGSVLRPASYCGIFGYKPTYGRINRAGLKFAAEGVDTIGWMARSLQDIALIDAVLSDEPFTELQPLQSLRVAVCQTYMWNLALPETRHAVEATAQALRDAGMEVESLVLPDDFARLTQARGIINDYERARALAYEWAHYREQISPELSASVQRGYEISHARYLEATRFAEQKRLQFEQLAGGYDAVLAPCVNGEAPEGLGYAGDPSFQSIWTLLHVPTVGLPAYRGSKNLPVSVQLVGIRHNDDHLLKAALAIWRMIS